MRTPYVFHSLSVCEGCGCSGDQFRYYGANATSARDSHGPPIGRDGPE